MRKKIVTTLWRSLNEILVIILLGSKSYAGVIASSFLHSHIPKDSQGDHKENEHFVYINKHVHAAHGQYSHLWHLLSPAWWSIFHLLPKWIQFCVVPLRGGKKPKSTTKITCASPITILLVILSPTAARDPPLANSQTTHLFPGLCCETSFFKHNKSNSFMSWAIVDFSLWLQMGMVCTNKSPDLSAITNKRLWVKYLARNIFYVFSLTVHPKSAEWWLGAVRRHW